MFVFAHARSVDLGGYCLVYVTSAIGRTFVIYAMAGLQRAKNTDFEKHRISFSKANAGEGLLPNYLRGGGGSRPTPPHTPLPAEIIFRPTITSAYPRRGCGPAL